MVSPPLEPCINFFHDHIPENGGGDGRSLVTFSVWLSSNMYEKNYSCWSAVNSEWISTERRLLIGSNRYVRSLWWSPHLSRSGNCWGSKLEEAQRRQEYIQGEGTQNSHMRSSYKNWGYLFYFICINFLAVWAFGCSVPAPLAVAHGHSSCGLWAL